MKKIYINPGHSDRDPGAVGYETERKLNVQVAGYMSDYLLENYSCRIRMNPGSWDSLQAICDDANAWGADLFVSIHFNAGGGDGFECYVYSEDRVPMGRTFEKHVTAAGQNSRGVKLRPALAVLRYTKMPAILTEGAFVDHLADIRDWNEEAELQKLGKAYALAAAEVLGIAPKQTIYSLEQFIRDVQAVTGSTVDGVAGPETLRNTVTVSTAQNSTHPVVKPIQKRLAALGYTSVGEADGIAGPRFRLAVMAFQRDNDCWVDGEITRRNRTWQKLLGMV